MNCARIEDTVSTEAR